MSERLSNELEAAQRSPEYAQAIVEDIVERVALVAGRNLVGFPDFLKGQMDAYAAVKADQAAKEKRELVEALKSISVGGISTETGRGIRWDTLTMTGIQSLAKKALAKHKEQSDDKLA